jgi:hypothetical protein
MPRLCGRSRDTVSVDGVTIEPASMPSVSLRARYAPLAFVGAALVMPRGLVR